MTPAQRAAARRTPEQRRALEEQRGKRSAEHEAALAEEEGDFDELEEEEISAAARRALRDPLTPKILTFIEVVLVCFPFVVFGATTGSDGAAIDVSLFTNPASLVSTLSNLAQVLFAGMLLLTQRIYQRGECGRAIGNIIVMLVAEFLFQNVIGIAGMVFALWRVLSMERRSLGTWATNRGVAGMLPDLVPGLVTIVAAVAYLIATVVIL